MPTEMAGMCRIIAGFLIAGAAGGCAEGISNQGAMPLGAPRTTANTLPAGGCDKLLNLTVPSVRFSSVALVDPDSKFVPPGPGMGPVDARFCRVQGVIEKEIGFELWLPGDSSWNGKLLTGGVGGQAGSFNYRELVRGIRRGYAAATTDTGHKASDSHWLLHNRERAENYAHRANHLLAVVGKEILAEYYSRPVKHSFFVGCSGGGRQALTEAQRYPEDYDGIIAGAPGPKTPEMSARRMWEMIQHTRFAGVMDDAAWQSVAKAGNDFCDGRDGLVDGIVASPEGCRFDIAALKCGQPALPGCLTDRQIEVAKLLYGPLRDENGALIDNGLLPSVRIRPEPVPEPFTPGPPYLAVALFGDGVHGNPQWDPRKFRIADDLPAIDKVMNLHADNPDLRRFRSRGGKLIVYQGWADPLVAAQPTVDYYRAVELTMGGRKSTEEFVRLFMIPGMEHCTGGNVPDLFGGAGGNAPVVDPDHDLLSALERWVERGQPPERIIASQLVNGSVIRTRPLCLYPMYARYEGIGSNDDAANFKCANP